MNNNLQMVYNYHNETKHSNQKYAKSLGYMDWATQPNPYRNYIDSKQTILPLALNHDTLPYHMIFDENEKDIAPICLQSISQLFQFSFGLAAIKVAGEQSWALRCNASSGNLQPTEAYIISQDIKGIDNGIHHYNVQNHNLELLANTNTQLPLAKDSFLIALSSIVWREAWKYGERSFRYTQLDCGHAQRALEVSAYMLGWKIQKVEASEDELNSLIGFDQKQRYCENEREDADVLFMVSKISQSEQINISLLRNCFATTYNSKANQLSNSWHDWDILNKISNATKIQKLTLEKNTTKLNNQREQSYESKQIILQRRSAQMMNPKDTNISFKDFDTIISSVSSSLDGNKIAVNLVFFIHDVQDLESGLYILIRDIKYKNEIRKEFKNEFLWQEISTSQGRLFLLRKGDYRVFSKTISCNQDIAKDGAFSIGMIADFSNELNKHGASRYKELYWECGSIGQQLYLEATSLGLSATGIGCYLDDMFHNLLGIENLSFQSLYHFTIGKGIFDSRLSTLEPYSNR